MIDTQRLEKQIQQSRLEAIGSLAGGIAHDFNNLITVINGYAQLALYSLKDNRKAVEDLNEILKAGDKAASLTRQLLAFSRRQVFELRIINLNQLIENMNKMLGRIIGEDIQLVTSLEKNLGSVEADFSQLENVIINLSVNARDAMPEGGILFIETSNVELDDSYTIEHISVKPGSYAMLCVSDTGMGMTVDVKKRIFEPFFTTKKMGKGTGLGLATTYGIIKQSGGNIWVYSEPGCGTTFKIYLPRVNKAPQKSKVITASTRIKGGDENIIVVEDDYQVQTVVVTGLRQWGYRVFKARNGNEALGIIDKNTVRFVLLLTDTILPDMNGKELSALIQKKCETIKILHMSGYTDNVIVKHGILEPGTQFIQKPFSINKLAQKVREVLDS